MRHCRIRRRAVLAVVMFALAGGCTRADNIAVFPALDADMKALSEAGTLLGDPVLVGTRKIQRLQIGPHRVYAALMGSGCVETAVTAEALLARFRCDRAFSIGPAGGLTETAATGSWWRVSECVAQGKSGGAGSSGQPLPFNAATGDWKLPGLLARAAEARLVSGEVFIQSAAQRESLATASGAVLVDMNSHGLHAACANHAVPLHVWRVVSDSADERAGETFRAFTASYDGAGGRALAELIAALPASRDAAGSYPGIRRLLRPSVEGK